MIMKKLFLTLFILIAGLTFSQTHSRKTRSDKGKTHSHSTEYYMKKALTPKPTKTKKKK